MLEFKEIVCIIFPTSGIRGRLLAEPTAHWTLIQMDFSRRFKDTEDHIGMLSEPVLHLPLYRATLAHNRSAAEYDGRLWFHLVWDMNVTIALAPGSLTLAPWKVFKCQLG